MPNAQRARLHEALAADLARGEAELVRDILALHHTRAPAPPRGAPMLARGWLWRWDWGARAYVADAQADPAVAARPAEPFVEASVRALVLEAADGVARVLQDSSRCWGA